MKAKNISYPHPVLGNENDAGGEFTSQLLHKLGRDSIALRIRFKLKNKEIERLIAAKKAVFAIELECAGTFFRRQFSTFEPEDQFTISANLVRELVSAGFFIRATEKISDYRPSECHPDYRGFSFDISPGDVLAVGGFTSFIAEKDFDPLKPAVSSFMAIKRGSEANGRMLVDYSDHDKIIIKLSQSDHALWGRAKGRVSLTGALHAAVVLPVLADAIALVRAGGAEFSDNYWFQRLQVILQQKSLENAESLTAAQVVLNNPVSRGLLSLVNLDAEEE